MEQPVLKDKSVYPTDDLVFSIIGNNSVYWKNLLKRIHETYPASEEVWTYYNDGKSWLFRVLLKKKTLFWIAVLKDTFRVTFYFGDKAEPVIKRRQMLTTPWRLSGSKLPHPVGVVLAYSAEIK
jgi:hypothetical protein